MRTSRAAQTRQARQTRRTWRSRPLSYVRVRVTLAALLAALLAAVLGTLLFLTSLRTALENQLITSAQQQVGVVYAQIKGGESPDQAVLTGKNDIVIQILDANGHIEASDHPRVITPLRTTPGTSTSVHVHRLTDRYVVVAMPRPKGGGLIVVGRSTEQIERATAASALLLAFSVPVGLALLSMVVWLAVGRALRPVEAMREEAATITNAHLHQRLAVPDGDDEIPRLAVTLNEMLDRVDDATRLQRQFVSDASHELRSPLAAMRQLAEVARDYPGAVAQKTLADDVLAEERRMEDLVSALLILARIDDGPAASSTPADLDDLVLEQARRLRTADGPRIDVSGVSAGQVHGDPVLLTQLVANLLSNAQRHAREVVQVSLHEYGDQVVLTVDDDGNGIPEADRARVFERFVRLDEARTRDGGGSGLGLAIVHKVVDELGGRVEVRSSDHGGARFVVALPTP